MSEADLRHLVQKQNETIRNQQEQIDELISSVQNLKTALMDLRKQFESFSGQSAVRLPGALELVSSDSYPDLTGFTASSSPHSLSSPLHRSRTSSLENGTFSDLPNRAKRIEEIVQTERTYIADLELIISEFLLPLKQNGIISNQEIMGLFSNLPSILEVNRKMLALFEETVRLCSGDYMLVNLGEIFLEMAEQFKVYEEYCANQQNALSLYEGLKDNEEFVAFLESCDQNPRCRNLPLFSFLIKPVQRICKYPLLLKDLIRDTDESMDDWRTLTAAKHKIDGIAEKVNENQKAAEGAQARDMQKLTDIANCIDTEDEELTIAAPHRKFLMEGDIEMVIKKDKKPRHAWLFNDLFIICAAKGKKERYSLKKRFDIKNLGVVDMADMEGLKNAFEVRNKNTDTAGTMICVETLEMKKKWVERLKAVLRDYQLQAVQRARKNGPVSKLHTRQASNSFGSGSLSSSTGSLHREETSDSNDQVTSKASSSGWISGERSNTQVKLNLLGAQPPSPLPPMPDSPKLITAKVAVRPKLNTRPPSQSLPSSDLLEQISPREGKDFSPISPRSPLNGVNSDQQGFNSLPTSPINSAPNSPGPIKIPMTGKRPPPQLMPGSPGAPKLMRVFVAKK